MRTYSRGPEKALANQGTVPPLTGRLLLYGDDKRNRRREEWRGEQVWVPCHEHLSVIS
jgi:hypothetical protein